MMRRLTDGADRIFLATGPTDFRKQISGLVAIVSMQFNLDPFQESYVFIFCNKKRDSIKVLRYDKNGFVLAAKKMFGPSTETTKQTEGQLFLFEEAQKLAEELGVEQKKITVKPYTRTPRKSGVRAEMFAGLPQEIEEYIIPEDETCNKCGGALKVVGKRIVRTEAAFEPAKLIVKQIVQQAAKCTVCGTEGAENPNCHFQKAAIPVPPLPHSLSAPSLIAQVMYQKFMMGLPFARQERDWYRLGLVLSRVDMANWVIRCCQEWLEPVYWQIHEKLMGCGVLHMDETRIQCNKEEGKKAGSESFIWVIRSAACEEIQAA